jgi:hypothetical protein
MTNYFEDKTLESLEIDVPNWIESDITVGEIEAIIQGGCASGAYMPAVVYRDALKTMNEHGDDVIEYLDNVGGQFDSDILGLSWSQMAVELLSRAVEYYALGLEEQIKDLRDEHESEERTSQ